MHSKRFLLELPKEYDEHAIYDALSEAGMKYPRVKPLRDDASCPSLQEEFKTYGERKRGDGIG